MSDNLDDCQNEIIATTIKKDFRQKISIFIIFLSVIVLIIFPLHFTPSNENDERQEGFVFEIFSFFSYSNISSIGKELLDTSHGITSAQIQFMIALITGFGIYCYVFGFLTDFPQNVYDLDSERGKFFNFFVLLFSCVAFIVLIFLSLAYANIWLFKTMEMISILLIVILTFYFNMDLLKRYELIINSQKNLDTIDRIRNQQIGHFWDPILGEGYTSFLFILTIFIPIFGITYQFNMLTIVFLNLFFLNWLANLSAISNLPCSKYDIKFIGNNNPPIWNVYILNNCENDILIVLTTDDSKIRIVKESIHSFEKSENRLQKKIVYQPSSIWGQ